MAEEVNDGKIAPVLEMQSLIQKILAIQASVGAVKKRGKFGSEMGGSNYLRIEDTVIAVGKLMAEKHLILTGTLATRPDGTLYCERIPHTTKGYIASVVMRWMVTDTDSGHTVSYDIPGDGYDTTDKAVYKAQTGSRKYAIINIFNLAIGNDVEASAAPSFDEGKSKQKNIAANKIAAAAAQGVSSAIDAMSQIEPERKLVILRPEEFNGHYIIACGFIAAPPLDAFFSDTGCKRIDSRKSGKSGWKVPQEYEKGLIELCRKIGVEVE